MPLRRAAYRGGCSRADVCVRSRARTTARRGRAFPLGDAQHPSLGERRRRRLRTAVFARNRGGSKIPSRLKGVARALEKQWQRRPRRFPFFFPLARGYARTDRISLPRSRYDVVKSPGGAEGARGQVKRAPSASISALLFLPPGPSFLRSRTEDAARAFARTRMCSGKTGPGEGGRERSRSSLAFPSRMRRRGRARL